MIVMQLHSVAKLVYMKENYKLLQSIHLFIAF
jgi:hypothetical protein